MLLIASGALGCAVGRAGAAQEHTRSVLLPLCVERGALKFCGGISCHHLYLSWAEGCLSPQPLVCCLVVWLLPGCLVLPRDGVLQVHDGYLPRMRGTKQYCVCEAGAWAVDKPFAAASTLYGCCARASSTTSLEHKWLCCTHCPVVEHCVWLLSVLPVVLPACRVWCGRAFLQGNKLVACMGAGVCLWRRAWKVGPVHRGVACLHRCRLYALHAMLHYSSQLCELARTRVMTMTP